MQRIKYRQFILVSCLLFIGACGQTGELYLPKETQEKPNIASKEPNETQQDTSEQEK
ncbi:LPS translocon maturation chaperone LptM [Pseudoalteromonas denitrificans]|uniref:Lipoprotein-attachment site-containing protein n=1 Tax=Pseudoalteromonas denitrificans DSM 6059 TaxID=1123010 RepID=A0A1I1SG75_9GAMM|nr:lipoprotein [Pseudoalteromonas denitrificans]SFD45494.1 hypothetical protein SAMN02745724_04571 [Pseudoalteromonas denitrificans DSM 6059]